MTPYCRRFITDEEIAIFHEIKDAVETLPDINLGKNENGKAIILSCHILARAVSKVFAVPYNDGYFHPNFEHSWIVIPGGHIVDLYPVSIYGGPILMTGGKYSIAANYYVKRSSKWIGQGRFSKSSFRRSVRLITKALQKIKYAKEKGLPFLQLELKLTS
jgi:hypothetical protein